MHPIKLISPDILETAFSKLSTNKAIGIDGLSDTTLKRFKNQLFDKLLLVFN
jgi:hypothetical protein